ncbi:MAG: hypothetical protein D6805_06105 [Planctomycetota bacterium]|nr:MAG: hypothetical protein D6805_06105 [Planctomycetota bacterium]
MEERKRRRNFSQKGSFSSKHRKGRPGFKVQRGAKGWRRRSSSSQRRRYRRSLPPEIKAKAEQLMEKNGLSFKYAVEVARGRKKLPEALQEMFQRRKMEELMRKHRLDRAMAGQVVHQRLSLEEAKRIVHFKRFRRKHMRTSCFTLSYKRKLAFVFECHGHRRNVGMVVVDDPYDITLQLQGEELRMPKLEVKYSYREEEASLVQPKVSRDLEVVEKGLGPIQRILDRYRIKDRLLFDYYLARKPVRFTTLEGDVLVGRIVWFNQYEIGLDLGERASVYLLRHALYSWEQLENGAGA